jgi:hypothetical protein
VDETLNRAGARPLFPPAIIVIVTTPFFPSKSAFPHTSLLHWFVNGLVGLLVCLIYLKLRTFLPPPGLRAHDGSAAALQLCGGFSAFPFRFVLTTSCIVRARPTTISLGLGVLDTNDLCLMRLVRGDARIEEPSVAWSLLELRPLYGGEFVYPPPDLPCEGLIII